MPRRPTLIRAPALIYFAHPLDPALIQGNTVFTRKVSNLFIINKFSVLLEIGSKNLIRNAK